MNCVWMACAALNMTLSFVHAHVRVDFVIVIIENEPILFGNNHSQVKSHIRTFSVQYTVDA